MANNQANLLAEFERIIDCILDGNPVILADEEMIRNECGDTFSDKLKQLIRYAEEMRIFACNLSNGDIDCETPGRDNKMAGTLKQLHMQLRNLAYSLGQLSKGKVVNKLFFHGALFDQFNRLVDYIVQINCQMKPEEENNNLCSSWSAYQSLAALNELKTMVFQMTLDGTLFFANKPALRYCGGKQRFVVKDTFFLNDPLLKYIMNTKCELNQVIEATIHDEKNHKWYSVTSEQSSFVGGLLGYTHTVDDITKRKLHELNLQRELEIDALTGARSRKAGLQALVNSVKQAQIRTPICTAFIDIDGLKQVNDTFGHTEGDYLIQTVAQALLVSVRASDVVSRYGGDEFLLVFNHCSLTDAYKVIERTRDILTKTSLTDNKPFLLDFSAGVASINDLLPVTHGAIDQIIKYMDDLMYREKQNKKISREQPAK